MEQNVLPSKYQNTLVVTAITFLLVLFIIPESFLPKRVVYLGTLEISGILIALVGFGFLIANMFLANGQDFLQNHLLVQIFQYKLPGKTLGTFFALMLWEELLFRGLVFSALDIFLTSHNTIFYSALTFAFYHIHIYYSTRNFLVMWGFIIYSFLLGLFLGFLQYYGGIGLVWIIHSLIVLVLFYYLSKQIKEIG